MGLQTIGENLLARDEHGRLRCRIATFFPHTATVVTLPGIHATQRLAYVQEISKRRMAQGLSVLTEDEEDVQCMNAVDLVIDNDTVLIRPDPARMPLAFEADELLQQILSKTKIKFLHVLNARVRQAIQHRGERWRMSPLPRSGGEMKQMIATSRIGIGGPEIYYYNKTSGTRFVTYQEFSHLAALPEPQRKAMLSEITDHGLTCNLRGSAEVSFFAVEGRALSNAMSAWDWPSLSGPELDEAFESMRRAFCQAVRPEFRVDDLECPQWRSRMYSALIGQGDDTLSEEALLGLSAEFFLGVEWLPGGRIEDGEFLLDCMFEEEENLSHTDPQRICDDKARGFIFNYIRDYGDVEFVNIGRVCGSLSIRKAAPGRRGVYLAEIKRRGSDQPILRIIRMQKWGVREHLDENKDLLEAMLESEQYTEYILDRRLGCRQLGMNLPHRVAARKVGEVYAGSNRRYHGINIWSAYFERGYAPGVATDKIPNTWFADDRFAAAFANLLGRAAAPNLIVGRTNLEGAVIFDDGDELMVKDPDDLPADILVADHTGTFNEYQGDLKNLTPAYARAVTRRAPFLPDPPAFGEIFLKAFIERFQQIQHDYHKRRRAFDTLFQHQDSNQPGSFAYRWRCVLRRLDAADPVELANCIRDHMGPSALPDFARRVS